MWRYTPLPCGSKIPSDTVHAVSVCLPRLSDLIGYENQVPDMLAKIDQGYPRFHIHPYIRRMQDHLDRELKLKGQKSLVTASPLIAEELCRFAGIERPRIFNFVSWALLLLPGDPEKEKKARAYLQHTGGGVSSRLAEDELIKMGLLDAAQEECCYEGDADARVRERIAANYGAAGPEDVYLAAFGMNGIQAVYRALSESQATAGRTEFVQFGWLFMDTIHIIEKFRGLHPSHVISSPLKIDELEEILEKRGRNIAGIFSETPSNPLLQTGDLPRLRQLADQYDIPLIIDATLGTPHNVDVFPYADMVVESLTKYANGSADLMMGAVVLNRKSPYYNLVSEYLTKHLNQPYHRDVARLGHQISGYSERMKKVNANTMILAEFFEGRASVKKVNWAYQNDCKQNYERIQRRPESPGGLITLELNVPLASVYDPLALAKGPSLGAEFTLVGPYLYHAHYDLVANEDGRRYLKANGLDPELLRVSVGIEDSDSLLSAFSQVM